MGERGTWGAGAPGGWGWTSMEAIEGQNFPAEDASEVMLLFGLHGNVYFLPSPSPSSLLLPPHWASAAAGPSSSWSPGGAGPTGCLSHWWVPRSLCGLQSVGIAVTALQLTFQTGHGIPQPSPSLSAHR